MRFAYLLKKVGQQNVKQVSANCTIVCADTRLKRADRAVCKTPRRAHLYEVKYSELYFTWKMTGIWGYAL
ncbi:hypothetical protein EFO98_03710 [Lactiplantibacillus argentoratensis]|nr:hypothetical protein [Lactiplantibacillus argentoratensis]